MSNGTKSFPTVAAKKRRDSIAIFYDLSHKEGKKYTYDHFKDCGLSQAGIYKILTRFDERGNVDRKSGSESRPTWIAQSYQEIIEIVFFNHSKQGVK